MSAISSPPSIAATPPSYAAPVNTLLASANAAALAVNAVNGQAIAPASVQLPATTGSATGVINSGGSRLLHAYKGGTSFGQNLFVGAGAGNFTMGPGGGGNELASYNIGIGSSALQALTTGYMNTVVGVSALQAVTSGYYNTAMGESSLRALTTGNSNTALGLSSTQNLTTGNSNTAVGRSTLEDLTTGSFNTAVGVAALATATTGFNNSAFGNDTLNASTEGYYNSAFGQSALYATTTGHHSSAFGMSALEGQTTGHSNSGFGFAAGFGDGTPNMKTSVDTFSMFLGYQSSRDASIDTATPLTNVTAIGKNARVAQSNNIILGGTGADAVNVAIGAISASEKLEVHGSSVMIKINAAANTFAQLGYYENGLFKWNVYNNFNTDNYVIGNGAGAQLSVLVGGGAEVHNGDVEVSTIAKGLILKSPDGTRYRITVANGGTLTVTGL